MELDANIIVALIVLFGTVYTAIRDARNSRASLAAESYKLAKTLMVDLEEERRKRREIEDKYRELEIKYLELKERLDTGPLGQKE